MAVMIDRLEISYWEGWDPGIRAAVGPLPRSVAAGRHRAGEQYAVLLAGAGRPLTMIRMAGQELYCGVEFFDDQLRRAYDVDCRQLGDGRLFVLETRQWRYADEARAEFEPADHPA
jgi:hypothetical protein